MKKHSQFLLPSFRKISSEFGSRLLQGKRKSARPVSVKVPMHLILKSESLIFRKNLKAHKRAVQRFASKFQIKIMAMAFNGNHVHLVIRVYRRDSYIKFVRAVASSMTSISGLNNAFAFRPYTRFIQWGRDLKRALSYLDINRLEADGIDRKTARLLTKIWENDLPS